MQVSAESGEVRRVTIEEWLCGDVRVLGERHDGRFDIIQWHGLTLAELRVVADTIYKALDFSDCPDGG